MRLTKVTTGLIAGWEVSVGLFENVFHQQGEALCVGTAGHGGVDAAVAGVVFYLGVGEVFDESFILGDGDGGFVTAGFDGEDGHEKVSDE